MGAALPLTLEERTKVEHAGVTWTLALVPAGKIIEWEQSLSAAYAPIAKAGEDAEARSAAMRAASAPLAAAFGDIVRWGVLGWDGAEPPREEVRYDGETFSVLTKRAVDRLLHVRRGALVSELADKVLEANRLTEADLVGFR